MAEFVLKDMVEKAGRSGEFEIESAATTTEEIWNGVGSPVYPPARKKLLEHGIDPGDKRARLAVRSDYHEYDYIIGMDEWNLRNMLRIVGQDTDHKLSLLLDYSNHPRDIADPWYTGNFEETYSDIIEGCTALLEKLKREL